MFDAGKTSMIGLPCGEINYDDTLSRFHLIPERNGQTDGQTDLLYQYRASICWRAIETRVPGLSVGANRMLRLFVFSRTLLRYVWLMTWAVRLSSVCCCILRRGFNFSLVCFHRVIAQGIGQFVLKFWKEMQRGSWWLCKLNGRGLKNCRIWTNISFISERYSIWP